MEIPTRGIKLTMSSDNLFKEVTAIHARLFHHTPALQGLTNYFIKEFEEKRGEREGLRINSTFKNMSYINDQGLPNSLGALQKDLANMQSNLNKATKLCKEISETEGQTSEPSFIESQRIERGQKWAEFIDTQCKRSARVDADYDSQVSQLHSYYSDLENKLVTTKAVL